MAIKTIVRKATSKELEEARKKQEKKETPQIEQEEAKE